MTCTHTTPQTRTVSTPINRYRYGTIEMPVLADPRLTANDKTVYATLKAHRNHRSGTAWPSRRTIGQIAGCTENHVTKSTRRLVEAGYLIKDQRPGRATVFRFPLADPVATTPIQTDWGERSTPIQTDGHNKQRFSSEQTKEPQQQQPVAERLNGSVVVVPEPIAKENLPLPVGGGETAPAAPDATQHETLAFPAIISLAMQVGIAKILCGLPCQTAQMLLDELAGAAQHTAIRNPIAYLRRLLSLHMSGELIPEHSHRIAAQRATQARNEAARQRALAMRLDERPPDTPPQTQKRDQSARLREMERMRQALGMRETGAG
jgi:hypothetical protein